MPLIRKPEGINKKLQPFE